MSTRIGLVFLGIFLMLGGYFSGMTTGGMILFSFGVVCLIASDWE